MGSIILSVISVLITIFVGWYQLNLFRKTKQDLDTVRRFFPDTPDYHVVNNDNGSTVVSTMAEGEIKSLMVELNQYIESNKGTTDFSIIQNKTERRTDTVYEKATAKLSFPTYVGLMGTFFGVLLGLVGFSFFGSEEERIDNLVHGVMVSMATSLLGLFLTTRGNRQAADAKEVLDTRKNQFYDFLQNSLMPSLGTSMVAALDRLRDTLGTFEPTFSSVLHRFESSFVTTIELFKDTFDTCTVNFGEEFRKNSELLNRGVDKMAHSVDLINANVDNQRQLLEEIRSTKMWDTLNRFVEVAGVLEQSAKHIEGLRDVGKMIEEQVMALMTAQEEYTKSLVVPKILSERINNLLDRVSTFEKSINNLGPAISSTDLIATDELNAIKKHLDAIEQRNFQVRRYEEMQTGKLEEFFSEQAEAVKALNVRYQALMEEHGEKLNEVLQETIGTLDQKRKAFLRAVEDAFDVAEINTQFSHLETLPRLEAALSKLEKQLAEEHSEMVDVTTQRATREDVRHLSSLDDIKNALLLSREDVRSYLMAIEESLNKIPDDVDTKAILKLQNQFFGRIDTLETMNIRYVEQLPPLFKEVADMKAILDNMSQGLSNEYLDGLRSELNGLKEAFSNYIKDTEKKNATTIEVVGSHLSDMKLRLEQIEKQLNSKRRGRQKADSDE